VDPFAWCAVLWGEDLFSPIEGEATWTAVALLAGALLGLKRGLELRIDQAFIPREMLEGCY
jgi:hypothetical protein